MMRHNSPIVCVILLLGYAISAVANDESAAYSADAYATCAACHLPDGAGVPSAFPPVKNRAAAIAALEGGRDYLVTVVSFGLMGNITIDGTPYFGVMAGNHPAMSAEEIATALNFIVFELNDEDAAEIDPFTAAEVQNVQASVEPKSPAAGGEKRKTLTAMHGEEWP